MEILREVSCQVMVGCGPKWINKNVTVFLDDVEDNLDDSFIYDMVIVDAKEQLKRGGFIHFSIIDVNCA